MAADPDSPTESLAALSISPPSPTRLQQQQQQQQQPPPPGADASTALSALAAARNRIYGAAQLRPSSSSASSDAGDAWSVAADHGSRSHLDLLSEVSTPTNTAPGTPIPDAYFQPLSGYPLASPRGQAFGRVRSGSNASSASGPSHRSASYFQQSSSTSIDPERFQSSTFVRQSSTASSSHDSEDLSKLPVISREGKGILGVGHASVCSIVPIDLLRSLYLRRQYETLNHRPFATDPSGAWQVLTPAPPPWTLSAVHYQEGDHGSTAHHSVVPAASLPTSGISAPLRAYAYAATSHYPPVRMLPASQKLRILVTGGAGFVGSHLVDRLMLLGHEVTVLDNFFTGSKTTVSHWIGHPNFELVRHDVVQDVMVECDRIYHLACPASPVHYQYNAVKTMKTSFQGTLNMLGLAKRVKARFLLASTSEVYGDPEVHPQPESYNGNVNPIGPRACYDEGKRVAETLTYGYARQGDVDVRVARIFNTFGPRMNPVDGRVVSNFILQALRGEDMTVYGDGSQTRSFMYVHDLIDGLILLMESEGRELEESPVNLGSSDECSILEFANIIREAVEAVRDEEDEAWRQQQQHGGVDGKENKLKEGEEVADELATPVKKPQSATVSESAPDGTVADPASVPRPPGRPGRPAPSRIIFLSALQDDPQRRRSDSSKAKRLLGWQPRWTMRMGVEEMVRYYKARLEEDGGI